MKIKVRGDFNDIVFNWMQYEPILNEAKSMGKFPPFAAISRASVIIQGVNI
jgi:hypothetical protein